MRIAYLVALRGGRATGPYKKIAAQVATWAAAGVDVGLFVATGRDAVEDWTALPEAAIVTTPSGDPLGQLRERRALAGAIAAWDPTLVYERQGLWFPGMDRLARRVPFVVEVNWDDIASMGAVSGRKAAYNRVTRGRALRRAAAHVYVTNELAIAPHFASFARRSLVLGNGIDLAAYPQLPAAPGHRLRLVTIGDPTSPSHGVDDVLALATALPDLDVDLIGPLPDNVPANVTTHGVLDLDQYLRVFATATAGIGPLGLYRAGKSEASSLKVREYLATGLPAVVGGEDTDFGPEARAVLRVPNRPGGVVAHVDGLLRWLERWRGRRVARDSVAHLDVREKELRRLDFLDGITLRR